MIDELYGTEYPAHTLSQVVFEMEYTSSSGYWSRSGSLQLIVRWRRGRADFGHIVSTHTHTQDSYQEDSAYLFNFSVKAPYELEIVSCPNTPLFFI